MKPSELARRTGALGAALLLAATPVLAQDQIMIGEPSWAGGRIMSRVIGQIIEKSLGHPVGYVPAANSVIFSSMDAGHGTIDVHPDVWLPNQQWLVDLYVSQNDSVALSRGSYSGWTGFCAPASLADAHGLKTVFDLATPEAAAALDLDGDGQGDIWIGEGEWSSTNVNIIKLRDYGIDSFFLPRQDPEEEFHIQLVDALDSGRGAAFYCYEPHYSQLLYDLVELQEPEFDARDHIYVPPEVDAQWLRNSRILTGDQPKTVRVAHARTLERRSPDVAAFLNAIDMEARDISEMAHKIVVLGQRMDDVVAAWVAEHPVLIERWLEFE